MSKLSKQIKALQLGQYQYVHTPMVVVDYSEGPVPQGIIDDGRYEKVQIDARFGCQVLIRDDSAIRPYEMQRAREAVRQAVIEEVFGEFRIDLRKLRMLIMNYEQQRALDCLDNIEKEMFDV